MRDPRVHVAIGDALQVLRADPDGFDAILLDVDNGPAEFAAEGNDALYGRAGLYSIRRALRPRGVLAVWSAWDDRQFARRLDSLGFAVTLNRVRSHGRRGARHFIYRAVPAVGPWTNPRHGGESPDVPIFRGRWGKYPPTRRATSRGPLASCQAHDLAGIRRDRASASDIAHTAHGLQSVVAGGDPHAPTRDRPTTADAVHLGAVLIAGLAVCRATPRPPTDTTRYAPLTCVRISTRPCCCTMRWRAATWPGRGAEATVLADISPTVPMPPGAEAFQGALTQAARDAAAAATLEDAAHATATLFGTCGQCHKANHVRATVPVGKDIQVGGLVGHMLLHQKGVDDLLEGLVAPSDAQWVEGVRIFASPKFDPHGMPGKMRKAIDHGETELAVLAGHAAPAQRTRDRVDDLRQGHRHLR